MGTSWISRKGEILEIGGMVDLEKGGMTPLINYVIDSLVLTMHIFSEDIGMQFGMKKYRVLIMERGKVIRTDGIRLPDG